MAPSGAPSNFWSTYGSTSFVPFVLDLKDFPAGPHPQSGCSPIKNTLLRKKISYHHHISSRVFLLCLSRLFHVLHATTNSILTYSPQPRPRPRTLQTRANTTLPLQPPVPPRFFWPSRSSEEEEEEECFTTLPRSRRGTSHMLLHARGQQRQHLCRHAAIPPLVMAT